MPASFLEKTVLSGPHPKEDALRVEVPGLQMGEIANSISISGGVSSVL
jgi:hypothetical protein